MKIVFVKRPNVDERRRGVIALLRATAKNGEAIRSRHRLTGSYVALLRPQGLIMRQIRRGNFYYAWCENGLKRKGAR